MVQSLRNKKVLLGLTGGIAAYKSAELCRALKKSGADVRVVMTQGAQEFITPLTMQALSGHNVHTSLLDPAAEAGMGHIELAKWPDLIIIAPASANFIARYAQGIADDLLTTLLLASSAPIAIAPAMNQQMWKNPLTQRNLSELKKLFGSQLSILGPAEGEQACGDIGFGRMLEADEIKCLLDGLCSSSRNVMVGKKVVITAGPTREAIDPVRYISNHSSGKMGYSLALSCMQKGAEVVLISGPTNLAAPSGLSLKNVVSAQDMYEAAMTELESGCDVFIACAAVADYRPLNIEQQKIKKKGLENERLELSLTQNPDIVAAVAKHKNRPFTVGFAAETNDLLHYAKNKLKQKQLDLIVANDVSVPGLGFNSDENEVYIVSSTSEVKLERQLKSDISDQIVVEIIQRLV